MSSIDAKITALAEAIKRQQMEQEVPVDDLSKSLFEFEQEIIAMSEQDKAALLESLNQPGEDGTPGLDLTPEDLERVIGEMK